MRVSKWVTMHGFALNVSNDLSFYQGIIPCGITSKGITRICDLAPGITMVQVKGGIIRQFQDQFDFEGLNYTSNDDGN